MTMEGKPVSRTLLRGSEGEIFHRPVHSTNASKGCSWTRLKPGASSGFCTWATGAKYLSHPLLLSQATRRQLVRSGAAGTRAGGLMGCWCCRLSLYLQCLLPE